MLFGSSSFMILGIYVKTESFEEKYYIICRHKINFFIHFSSSQQSLVNHVANQGVHAIECLMADHPFIHCFGQFETSLFVLSFGTLAKSCNIYFHLLKVQNLKLMIILFFNKNIIPIFLELVRTFCMQYRNYYF